MYKAALTPFTQAALQAQGPRPYGAVVVKDAVMVGALLKVGSNPHCLSEADDGYLASMITEGPRIGIWFAPDFTAHVCNLRYQHDFLAAAKNPLGVRPQLLSFNYVYYSRRGSSHCVNPRIYTQSQHAFVDGVWHEAAVNTGAPVVINIHKTGEELPTRVLQKAPFELKHEGILTSDCKRMDVLVRRDLISQRLSA